MNRPTDINTSADFIIVDISGVPQSLQEAMNVFVTGFMSMRFRTDTRKETIIAVDEGAVYLRNPQLALFLLQTLTQGRSFNISLWLATQQPSDLQKAGLDTEFKTNIQISIVLGNMRKDTIAHVKSFYSLNENNVNDLMACGVGEGLVIVGDQVIPTKFTATEHEIAIIKGRKVDQKVESPSLYTLVHEGLKDLISDHQIYISDWLVPGQDITLLSKQGYKQYKAQNINGKPGYVWLPQKNVIGEMVGNQSIDHYATVLQLAAYFIMNNIPLISINHNGDVDLIIEVNGKKVAIEYERPGSHNFNELVEKRQRAESVADVTFFVCQAGNLKEVSEAVGEKNTISRGSELIERLTELIRNRTEML
jgi:hypothetical protein